MREPADILLVASPSVELEAVVSAVSAVHGFPDHAVPIPMRLDAELSLPGRYTIDAHGRPASIAVHPRTHTAALSVLHEVGHYVDGHAIPSDTVWTWASETDVLVEWRSAVHDSEAVAQLNSLVEHPPLPAHRTFFMYTLKDTELFARSYAQYVATRSGSGMLSGLLDDSRARLHYPEYWANYDFEPIGETLDAAFGGLGWTRL